MLCRLTAVHGPCHGVCLPLIGVVLLLCTQLQNLKII